MAGKGRGLSFKIHTTGLIYSIYAAIREVLAQYKGHKHAFLVREHILSEKVFFTVVFDDFAGIYLLYPRPLHALEW